jgi:DNA-binding CsgD family transcriptional regulator
MGLSPKTVKNYLSSVFGKMHVGNRTAAVAEMLRRSRTEPAGLLHKADDP